MKGYQHEQVHSLACMLVRHRLPDTVHAIIDLLIVYNLLCLHGQLQTCTQLCISSCRQKIHLCIANEKQKKLWAASTSTCRPSFTCASGPEGASVSYAFAKADTAFQCVNSCSHLCQLPTSSCRLNFQLCISMIGVSGMCQACAESSSQQQCAWNVNQIHDCLQVRYCVLPTNSVLVV